MSALECRKDVLAQKKAFPIADLGWTAAEDLDAVVEACQVVSVVAANEYGQMNIEDTFSKLILCGDMLQLAYTTAGTQSCSKNILDTLNQYQTLVNQSFTASASFVQASVEALRVHKLVFRSFQKNKTEMAFKQYAKVGELAKQMAIVAAGVAKKAESLVELATGGLLEAKGNEIVTAAEQKKIRDLISEMAAERKMIIQIQIDLQSELDTAREEEEKFAKEASTQRDRAFAMQIVGALVGGIGAAASSCTPFGMLKGAAQPPAAAPAAAPAPTAGEDAETEELKAEKRKVQGEVARAEALLQDRKQAPDADTVEGRQGIAEAEADLKKGEAAKDKISASLFQLAGKIDARAESLDAKAASATARRRLLADQKRTQNASLEKNIEVMSTMNTDKTKLDQTRICLTTTIRTMGEVVTTFKNIELFWMCVSKHCMTLAGLNESIMGVWNQADGDERELEGFDLVSEQFYESAVGWAALGSVNRKANLAMLEAKESVDSKMVSLPGPEETAQKTRELCANMKCVLAAENKTLDQLKE